MSKAESKLPPNEAKDAEQSATSQETQASAQSEQVTIEREEDGESTAEDTSANGANGKHDLGQEAREFMRKSADSLRKGAEEARKQANALIEMSRKISFHAPDWAADPFRGAKTFTPRADFWMNAAAYEIAVELPGIEESSVRVKHANGQITVSGEKANGGAEEDAKTYFLQERQFGRFERSFRVPNDVDPGKIEARIEKNVLKITLPKYPEATVPERDIEVKAG